MKDSIQNITTEKIESVANGSEVNLWFWVALIELAIIIILIVLQTRKSFPKNNLKRQFKADALEADTDMSEVMQNIFQSGQLYDQLKRKCHPDRFIDPELRQKADVLFQQITENKRNYSRLLELRKQAESELNINF